MIRLDPPIPLDTIRGKAHAHFLIDYGVSFDLYWVCFLLESGECWVLNNKDIRLEKNFTMGIRHEPIHKNS